MLHVFPPVQQIHWASERRRAAALTVRTSLRHDAGAAAVEASGLRWSRRAGQAAIAFPHSALGEGEDRLVPRVDQCGDTDAETPTFAVLPDLADSVVGGRRVFARVVWSGGTAGAARYGGQQRGGGGGGGR